MAFIFTEIFLFRCCGGSSGDKRNLFAKFEKNNFLHQQRYQFDLEYMTRREGHFD